MKFHHVGIPTTVQRPGETYLEGGKFSITDAAANPYHIEWLRFDDGSPMPEPMKAQPHVAFEVDDLRAELAGKSILLEPFAPFPGIEVAFIVEDGALIELMQRTA